MPDKCTVTYEVPGGAVLACDNLNAACFGWNPTDRRQGIYCREVVRDGEPKKLFFKLKSGSYAANGAALNYCPFCGEDIRL